MTKPDIRIHYGARANVITVDGKPFERSKLSKSDFTLVRNVVIDTLVKTGAVHRRAAA